jgi:hypothetical protein
VSPDSLDSERARDRVGVRDVDRRGVVAERMGSVSSAVDRLGGSDAPERSLVSFTDIGGRFLVGFLREIPSLGEVVFRVIVAKEWGSDCSMRVGSFRLLERKSPRRGSSSGRRGR